MDAAAFVSTAQLDLGHAENAPDFTALSFYKIFGFPILGALIVRNGAGHVLRRRRYLGGGTVDMVVNDLEITSAWHAKKQSSLHEMLEDGTPAFASIIALGSALEIHGKLYGSMKNISEHTSGLVKLLYKEMAALTYNNGEAECKIDKDPPSTCHGDSKSQGPTIAFNIKASNGHWIGKTQFEQAAITANIQLRTGGVASALDLGSVEMKENFAEGARCGNDVDEMHGKPTGIIRLSLGAMSSLEDINKFLKFLRMLAKTEEEQRSSLDLFRRGPKPSVDAVPTSKASYQALNEWARFEFEARSVTDSTIHSAKGDTTAFAQIKQMLASPTLDERCKMGEYQRGRTIATKGQNRRKSCVSVEDQASD